jgi:hypothetical protein
MPEILFAFLSTRTEFRDAETCRRELVGPMRQDLSSQGDLSLLKQFPDMPPRAASLLKRKSEANDKLRDFCQRCGRCAWGEFMPPPLPGKDRA